MTYALENKNEFSRLEEQSHQEAYNYKTELKDFHPRPGKILDAGCGSGIVSRYLADQFPKAQIFGCDMSESRIELCKKESSQYQNLTYSVQNLTDLTYGKNSFDGIVCRYVLEHLTPVMLEKTLSEFTRCLKPKGVLQLIDIDGLLFNIYPHTPLVHEVLMTLEKTLPMDLKIGRKLPFILKKFGFNDLHWKIETLQFQGQMLAEEIHMIEERFHQTADLLKKILGSDKKASLFQEEYLSLLTKEGTVLFYNKFIARAKKSNPLKSVGA